MELSDKEKLFVAQAFYKTVAEMCETGNPDNLRGKVDAAYREKYEKDGDKGGEARIGGVKVGTYSVRTDKARKADRRQDFKVVDPVALLKWVKENSACYAEKFALNNSAMFAESYLHDTGEMPDGCKLVETVIDAAPERYKCGVLNIEPQLVADALGARLPEAMNLLIEGDSDAA